MYRLLYSERAKWSLDRYFDQFKTYYKDLYSNTGIFSENLIQANYVEIADHLFDAIDTHINKKLWTTEAYGRRPDPENPGQFTLITLIEDRTLIIEYREDTENLTRTVIELRIFRE